MVIAENNTKRIENNLVLPPTFDSSFFQDSMMVVFNHAIFTVALFLISIKEGFCFLEEEETEEGVFLVVPIVFVGFG